MATLHYNYRDLERRQQTILVAKLYQGATTPVAPEYIRAACEALNPSLCNSINEDLRNETSPDLLPINAIIVIKYAYRKQLSAGICLN